jgi:hypothetical protein
MQFTVQTFPITPDLPRVEAALADLDPSAIVDFDARSATLRLSTLLEPSQIAQALSVGGLAVDAVQVMRMPSECCGGCGG